MVEAIAKTITQRSLMKSKKRPKEWNWVEDFCMPFVANFVACFGTVNSGKSVLSFYLIERFLKRNPNGKVFLLTTKAVEEIIQNCIQQDQYRANFIILTDIVDPRLFTGREEPKLILIDEAVIFMNNKDWGSLTSEFFEKFMVIFRHKSLRVIWNAQNDKVLGSLLQMATIVIYKKCVAKFLDKIEDKGDKYVKQYRDYIYDLDQEEYLVDDGRKRTREPIVGKNPLPQEIILWSEELSHSFSSTTFDEFCEILYRDKTVNQLSLDDKANILLAIAHIEHKYSTNMTQDKKTGVVRAITEKSYNRTSIRPDIKTIESLLMKFPCPYCNVTDPHPKWAELDFQDVLDDVYTMIDV